LYIGYFVYFHGKIGFTERAKILTGYRKVILLNYQNNYVERSKLLVRKFFAALLIFFKVPTKL